MDQVELKFRDALQAAVAECRKFGYAPNRFTGMLSRSSPFEVVRSLLASHDVSEGFKVLWEKGRLDLSVEAIVLRPEWRGHFSEAELLTAQRRLSDVNYHGPSDHLDSTARPEPTEIERLLDELVASSGDREKGKRIRSRLRQLGHYGGLRQRTNDIERGAARSAAPSASQASPRITIPLSSTPRPSVPPDIPDAEALIKRIHALAGLPERNHEDVVKDLLIRLGFDSTSIIFQMGRIDLRVLNQQAKTVAVFEVKRTIAAESGRKHALRQGMDYASQTGALIIVVTDGDRYEIYDRRRGHDYDAMLSGRFQLTAFHATDGKALDLLRPAYLNNVRA